MQSSRKVHPDQLDNASLERLMSLLSPFSPRMSGLATQVIAEYCQCAHTVCHCPSCVAVATHPWVQVKQVYPCECMAAGGPDKTCSGPKYSFIPDGADFVPRCWTAGSSVSSCPAHQQQHQVGGAVHGIPAVAAGVAVSAQTPSSCYPPRYLHLLAKCMPDAWGCRYC